MKTIIAIVTYSILAGIGIDALEPSMQHAAMVPACVLGCLMAIWGVRRDG